MTDEEVKVLAVGRGGGGGGGGGGAVCLKVLGWPKH